MDNAAHSSQGAGDARITQRRLPAVRLSGHGLCRAVRFNQVFGPRLDALEYPSRITNPRKPAVHP